VSLLYLNENGDVMNDLAPMKPQFPMQRLTSNLLLDGNGQNIVTLFQDGSRNPLVNPGSKFKQTLYLRNIGSNSDLHYDVPSDEICFVMSVSSTGTVLLAFHPIDGSFLQSGGDVLSSVWDYRYITMT
jgi:hypothetical protein